MLIKSSIPENFADTTRDISFKDYEDVSALTDMSNRDESVIKPYWLYYLVKLNGEVGELSEKIGKIFRDKNGVFSSEDIRLIRLEVGDILWYLARLSSALGFSLAQAAVRNMFKLSDRMERNKIHGKGDER